MGRRLLWVAVGLFVGIVVAGGVAWAAGVAVPTVDPQPSDRYYACVRSNGVVRYGTIKLNVQPTTCPAATDRVRWWSGLGQPGVDRVTLPGNIAACRSTTDWGSLLPGTGAGHCGPEPIAGAFAVEVDSQNYPQTPTVAWSAVFTSQSSEPSRTCVRLYDMDTESEVAGSAWCKDVAGDEFWHTERFTVQGLTLPAGVHHLLIQSRAEYPVGAGWAATLYDPELIVRW